MRDIMVPISPDDIAEEVALQYQVSIEELRSKKRNRHISEARSVAMYLTRELTCCGFIQIGDYFFRDHSTAIFLYEKVRKRIETDDEFRSSVNDIREKVLKDVPGKRNQSLPSAAQRNRRIRKNYSTKSEDLPAVSYSFDDFIVGKSNQLAYEAAWELSENTASHNPLCIYSGHGLGKTHLLHAIENHMAQRHSTLYITAEQFSYELIDAIHRGYEDQFRTKYRNMAGCLLIDDMQFLVGKERTQQELLHIIYALNEKGVKIVASSDVLPKDISGLNPQLQKFFEDGLNVEIHPPDDVLKYKVLMQYMRRCHGDNIPISDDALDVVIKYSSSFQILLQIGNRLNAYANLTGKAITILDIMPPI